MIRGWTTKLLLCLAALFVIAGGVGVAVSALGTTDARSSGVEVADEDVARAKAAVRQLLGAEVTSVEREDGAGTAYEVEFTSAEGDTELLLDENFDVAAVEEDGRPQRNTDSGRAAETARALARLGDVIGVERDNGDPPAYEVELARPDGVLVLELDARLNLVEAETKREGDDDHGARRAAAHDGPAVEATVETDRARGDADDPAIWVHPSDPSLSLVIGTDKEHGLAVYGLDGRELQFLDEGQPNNVDVRDGFPLGGGNVSLVVAADDEARRLWVYRVDPDGRRLVDVAARPIRTGIAAHGLCLYRSGAGRYYAFPNDDEGRTEQWELVDNGAGQVDARRVRGPWDVGGAIEGCVADDELDHLYIGEEGRGIWRYGAEPDAPTDVRRQVDVTGPAGHLTADVEGLAIRYGPGESGYIIASSQGDHTFVVYARGGDNAHLAKFSVKDGAVDGCNETDGLELTAHPLGSAFPGGLFVCHDGDDEPGTNFKLVPLEHLERIAGIAGR